MSRHVSVPVVVLLPGLPTAEGTAPAIGGFWIWEALNATDVVFRCCTTVGQLFAWLAKEQDTIVVLDAGTIDNVDGYTLCTLLRNTFQAGVILLVHGGADDRARGLHAGADLCLSSPVGGPELSAILHALHRRTQLSSEAPPWPRALPDAALTPPMLQGDPLPVPPREGYWIFSDQGWSLRTPANQIMRLTQAEREFLTRLFSSPDYLFLRASQDSDVTADLISHRKLDVVVSRLRVKAGRLGPPLPLHTCRGMGYQFSGKVLLADQRDVALGRLASPSMLLNI
ncbi:response regulator transcription factor [Achromobacter sp. DH1f]|uniref:response regulator transcription factor n=1 Tax=Achromobacter sp. DH1f TaxID=1397275 RepID=UPI000469EA7D|nr:response regulator transcription factor [Achromobacter sp. DH1f]